MNKCLTQLFAGALSLAFSVLLANAQSSDLPKNYKLQYEQTFDSKSSLNDFMMTDPSAWEWKKIQGNPSLALTGASKYEPTHRSPFNIALIKGMTFGSFVLEVDVQQLGVKGTPIKEYMKKYESADVAPGYNHRDHCFFYNFVDPDHFMYTHIAKAGDDHAHSIFVVNEAPRTSIVDFRTFGADWGVDKWKKIRIVRNVEKGTVAIYFEDMLTPIMVADEIPFEAGFIGFGSFDDIGAVDNIKIWAPKVTKSDKVFFK